MYTIINQAIYDKKIICLKYKNYHRIVEPYLYGIGKKGEHLLYAFQTQAENLFSRNGWRLFELSKTSQIQLLEKSFTKVRKDYKKGMKNIETFLSIIENCH